MAVSLDQATELWELFLAHPVVLIAGAASVAGAAFLATRFMYERQIATLRSQGDQYKEDRDTLKDDVERLRRHALLAQAAAGEAEPGPATPYGRKYTVRGILRGPDGRSAPIVSVWIVLAGEQVPRLVTAYPEPLP